MREKERERERTTKRIRPRGRAEKENDATPPSRETDGLFFVAPPLLLETRITTPRSPARARALSLSQKVSLVFDGALREREKKKREKINARILFLRVLRRRRRRRRTRRRRRLPRFCRGLSAFSSSSSSSSSFSAAAKAPAFSRRRCRHYDDDDLRLSSFNSTKNGG